MVCIYCGSPTSVINSRLQKRANQVWRRRHCPKCSITFTTEETASLLNSLAVQHSSSRIEPFAHEKLLVSIYDSCRHRPNAASDAAALTQTVIQKLLGTQQKGVTTRNTIVQTTREVLMRFDTTAATIYQAFNK